jgi:hypothetical protein
MTTRTKGLIKTAKASVDIKGFFLQLKQKRKRMTKSEN